MIDHLTPAQRKFLCQLGKDIAEGSCSWGWWDTSEAIPAVIKALHTKEYIWHNEGYSECRLTEKGLSKALSLAGVKQ